MLKMGDHSSEVLQWQNFLLSQGYSPPQDGVFGASTDSATRVFQKDNGLIVDGVVGPETIAFAKTHLHALENIDIKGDGVTSKLPLILLGLAAAYLVSKA